VLKKLTELLPHRQRIRASLLLLLTLFTAGMEAMGIASVAPFLAVLARPDLIERSGYISKAYHFLGLESREQFLLLLGILSFIGLVFGTACRAINSWAQIRFSRSLEYGLARRLMTGYLGRPYAFFLGRNPADLSRMVLQEVSIVVNQFISPTISILSSAITTISLLVLLCLINATLALTATAVIGGFYAVVFFFTRKWLSASGKNRMAASQKRFRAATEVFGGFKEIKLLGNENFYLKKFTSACDQLARIQSTNAVIASMPGYGLELIVFGGVILITLFLLQTSNGVAGMVPILGVFVLCARRMLPAMKVSYKNVSTVRFSKPAADRLVQDLHEIEASNLEAPTFQITRANRLDSKIEVKREIALENVSLIYPNASKYAVHDINLRISAGSRVGFVGATGSGKTTTMDVILGLLTPSKGSVLVDGTPIGPDNVRAWQANLGYVPQGIYLADDTVAANIALGVRGQKIDRQAVETAARVADIHDFVVNELPLGYMTTVGDRGVRLSGGQRQRIGIARALYHNPKVLFFDEATSALDNYTEQIVMDRIQSLGRDMTMIFIAHRISTVRDCDMIYVFVGGELEACGSYAELTATSKEFQSLVGQENLMQPENSPSSA
jgi:ABC-type bacteriocin/lantibiotic exporter with double-glycine peptidase domain